MRSQFPILGLVGTTVFIYKHMPNVYKTKFGLTLLYINYNKVNSISFCKYFYRLKFTV